MPELPEVETIKKQLKKSLKGKKIKDVFVWMDKMVKVGPGKISNIKKGSVKESETFKRLLRGRTIKDVRRRAKFLIIETSGKYFLFIHLRMSGQLILAKPKEVPTKHTHVVLVFKDNTQLFYRDYRQFGHMRLVNQEEAKKVLEQEALGPEPLTMQLKEFFELIKKHGHKRVKDFLLNQRVIAGIGNIYADESLFMAKVKPGRKVGTLKQAEVKALHQAIQQVLKKAITLKGSSLRSYVNINGSKGNFVKEHQVYGRAGKACLRCKNTLHSAKIGSRTTVFCPSCQK